jgi:hypothetical protein
LSEIAAEDLRNDVAFMRKVVKLLDRGEAY